MSGRNELRPMWMTDLSKGGLFVETDDPPPLRHRVTVFLHTPEGTLELGAEVVHVLDADRAARAGQRAGVGLQFVDLDSDRRRNLEGYVEGLVDALAEATAAIEASADAERIVLLVKQIHQGFEQEDLYAALGLEGSTTTEEIRRRIDAMATELRAPCPSLSAAQASRRAHALRLLRRIGAMMTDTLRRFDYDLRHGHEYPRHRLAEAGESDQKALRQEWHRRHPEALVKAEEHAKTAIKYAAVLKYEEAIGAAKEALVHDPFNPELWRATETWREAFEKHQSEPTPPPPRFPRSAEEPSDGAEPTVDRPGSNVVERT